MKNILGAIIHVLLGRDKKEKADPLLTTEEIAEHYATINKAKAEANNKQVPWVGITGFEVDMDNLDIGNFEFDNNELFIARLRAKGYVGDTDGDVMDQWFTDVCRNVVLESYQQVIADPTKRKNLGGGRTEYT